MNRPTNDFLKSLCLAGAARLHASQRLAAVDGRITLLNVVMAFYIIALTIVPKFVDMPYAHRNWCEFSTIVLSILLMVFILLQYASKNALRIEQFHKSGLEIQEIQRLVQFKGFNVSEREFQELSKRYDDILQRYSLKTDPVDELASQLGQGEMQGMGSIELGYARLRIWIASCYPILLICLVSIGVLTLLGTIS